MRERLPVVLGTLVSQTLLNIVALACSGTVMFATVGVFRGSEDALVIATIAPVVLLALVIGRPACCVGQAVALRARAAGGRRRAPAMVQVRMASRCSGGRGSAPGPPRPAPRLGPPVALVLRAAGGARARPQGGHGRCRRRALRRQRHRGAAGHAVEHRRLPGGLRGRAVGLRRGETDAFAYGIILQAVEIATALAMGMPALVREGMTWRDLRVRALHAAPVELRAAASRRAARDGAKVEA